MVCLYHHCVAAHHWSDHLRFLLTNESWAIYYMKTTTTTTLSAWLFGLPIENWRKAKKKHTHTQIPNFNKHGVIALIPFNKMISFSTKLLSIFHEIHFQFASINWFNLFFFFRRVSTYDSLQSRSLFIKQIHSRYTDTSLYTVTVISAIKNK